MEILKKLLQVGGSSQAVVLPKIWLDSIERKTGNRPTSVLITFSDVDDVLVLKPILLEEQREAGVKPE